MTEAPLPAEAAGPLVVLVPVLDRPHRVAPLVASVRATVPEARVLFVTDPGDDAEVAAIEELMPADPLVFALECGGRYAAKVNAAVRATEEPLLFLGADDLDFKPGWFEAATAKLTEGIGLVGTNDLGNARVMRGEHATHFLMTRAYAELPTIDGANGPLCEQYEHNCVDDELIGTARKRGAYAHAADSHVEHLHPFWRKAAIDDTYRKGQRRFDRDRRLREKRRRLWR